MVIVVAAAALCLGNNCAPHATCYLTTVSDSSFSCVCNHGYTGDGVNNGTGCSSKIIKIGGADMCWVDRPGCMAERYLIGGWSWLSVTEISQRRGGRD